MKTNSRLPLIARKLVERQRERSFFRRVLSISVRLILAVVLLFFVLATFGFRWEPSGTLRSAAFFASKTSPPPECLCEGENFCFKGLDERGGVRWGRRFDCGLLGALRAARLTDEAAARTPLDAAAINASDQWAPVFATVMSSNHFAEGRRLIRSIHAHYPKSRVLIVDIGLEPSQTKEARAWCNVEVRPFNFSRYPEHVRDFRTYAFKLAFIEAFRLHKTFFFSDASVRLTGRNFGAFLRGVQAGELPPFSTHTTAVHSVFATTHPSMAAFLPLPLAASGCRAISRLPHWRTVEFATRFFTASNCCWSVRVVGLFCKEREKKLRWRGELTASESSNQAAEN
ncbi:hypothetical protein M3Y99_00644300 [Aphelenchoides fujianensis]|nr:hypothetical protein M3Y99_00644300 [Aphelenchoides fujianensis]